MNSSEMLHIYKYSWSTAIVYYNISHGEKKKVSNFPDKNC